jgi:hypothetical protein
MPGAAGSIDLAETPYRLSAWSGRIEAQKTTQTASATSSHYLEPSAEDI